MTDIKDAMPYAGRVTIYYSPPGAMASKSLVVPRGEFLEACAKFADMLAGEKASGQKPSTKGA
jgi:hypothetical protein